MSTEILEAIDAEVDRLGVELAELNEQVDRRRKRTEALSMTRELVEGLENGQLEQLHQGLEGLIGLAAPVKEPVKPPPSKKPTRSKPKGGRKKVAPATTERAPTEAERSERNAEVMERHKRILALARERGEITAVDIIEAGIASKNSARSSLQRMSMGHTGRTLKIIGERPASGQGGRPAKLYAPIETAEAPADDDGAKTGPERRVLAAIREAGGSLDETTLAGAAEMPSANVRTYAGGLVNRQVLVRKVIEGVTFYELPKADG